MLFSQWMMPHACIHGWTRYNRFIDIPRTKHACLDIVSSSSFMHECPSIKITSKLSHNPFANFPSVFASRGAMTMISAQLRSYGAHECQQTLAVRRCSNLPRYARWGQLSFSIPKQTIIHSKSTHTLSQFF